MLDAYKDAIDKPQNHDPVYIWLISALLSDTGLPDQAFGLCAHLSEHYRKSGDKNDLQAALGNQALILQSWGKLDEAMALLKEEERICQGAREYRTPGNISDQPRSLAGVRT